MQIPRLFVTRGPSGAGKTTVARELVLDRTTFEDGKATNIKMVAVSRDEFRAMFNGKRLGLGRQEQAVTEAQDATITALLGIGLDVVVHDTNLRDSDIRRFQKLATAARAEVHVIDLRDVPMAECIRRDALRPGAACVGEQVIRDQFTDHIDKPGVATRALAAAASVRATR